MTNLEKFEQVFGIKLDPYEARNTDFPCSCANIDFCDKHTCADCPTKKFWTKEYVEKAKLTTDEEAYAKNDEDATYTYGTEFVKEAISYIK